MHERRGLKVCQTTCHTRVTLVFGFKRCQAVWVSVTYQNRACSNNRCCFQRQFDLKFRATNGPKSPPRYRAMTQMKRLFSNIPIHMQDKCTLRADKFCIRRTSMSMTYGTRTRSAARRQFLGFLEHSSHCSWWEKLSGQVVEAWLVVEKMKRASTRVIARRGENE